MMEVLIHQNEDINSLYLYALWQIQNLNSCHVISPRCFHMICGAFWNFSQGAKKVQRHVISGDAQLIHDLAGPQGLQKTGWKNAPVVMFIMIYPLVN